MRSADRTALPVGRSGKTGIWAAASRRATDWRQVNATVVCSCWNSRSWNEAIVAAPETSSRTCTPEESMPSSANASSASAWLSTSMLDRPMSRPSRLARSRAAYRALPLSWM